MPSWSFKEKATQRKPTFGFLLLGVACLIFFFVGVLFSTVADFLFGREEPQRDTTEER